MKKRMVIITVIVVAIVAIATFFVIMMKQRQTKQQETGNTCGGIAGVTCPDGYSCDYGKNTYPDSTGHCIPE